MTELSVGFCCGSRHGIKDGGYEVTELSVGFCCGIVIMVSKMAVMR